MAFFLGNPRGGKKGANGFCPQLLPPFRGPKTAKNGRRLKNGHNQNIKKSPVKQGKEVVGATRFELVTFCTPSKRATSLRYAPTGFLQIVQAV